MKKLMFVILLFVSTVCNAQAYLHKGDITEMSCGFNQPTNAADNMHLELSHSYMFNSYTSLGAGVGYNHNPKVNTDKSVLAYLQAKQYLFVRTAKIVPFLTLHCGVQCRSEFEPYLSFGGGFVHNVSENFGLIEEVRYQRSNMGLDGTILKVGLVFRI